MARRTTIYPLIPWTGGVNTSVDSGVLPANDLVQADNVVFATSGSRLKREGFDYFDSFDVPASATRSSSGTTRTIVFSSAIDTTDMFHVGEPIIVTGSSNVNFNSPLAHVISVSGSTLTYTYTAAPSLTASSAADTGITITRNYDIIRTHDFWYFDSGNNQKQQLLIAVSSAGYVYSFSSVGDRKLLSSYPGTHNQDKITFENKAGTASGDYVVINDTAGNKWAVYADLTGADAAPTGAIYTAIPSGRKAAANLTTAVSAAQVAAAFELAFDGLSGVTFATDDSIADGSMLFTMNATGPCDTPQALSATDAATTGITGERLTVGTVPATALVGPISAVDMRTFNNKCIMTFTGLDNTPKFYDAMDADFPNTIRDLPGAPNSEFMQEFLGRLFMNDKTNKDYLHFSATYDETLWLGHDDSGAIYVGIDDGDPEGITGIAPPFKGALFVGKGEKVFRIEGDAPENFVLVPMTNGLGFVNHSSAVARDFDDVYFMSRRGFHSVVATDTTGDFEGNFLSSKIQPTFNIWNKVNLRRTQAVYIEPLNSVVWAVSEDGASSLSALWIFNASINQGEWYRWPNLNPRSVGKRLQSEEVRIIIGTSDGRIRIGQNQRYDDDGAPYTYRVKSGTIYPDQNPQTIKGFKRISLLFREKGRFSFQAYFKVDGQTAQSFTFEQTLKGDRLAVDFVLGSSILGSDVVMAPVTKQVLGYGRGCTIELAQTGSAAQVEIYGIMIEYESADIADEVKGA